ncbi:metallopeptidase [Candidatus Shapirobacteria bacterium CG08_land_8_20_14_0_20_39_18]|uniref:Metallopeptidase n=1 Tax=Candidatus Shapirobacteria bacterium CG08_land_8_20_14_0_20_39_18 TaxID=1974883 RepID=A0A2M6XD09_9BACT|nr:MAG: metallopeptidase [Candidatus Shapirobacteria bacterium CG08_land_8_20_14_0_20_39_18]PIY65285.1 MAG: metallopeptidase [Candidatus Shapirobacteria bacterium CG_4_10_14_0_8_um_filter_39_15]PJE68117.1 MAG: metallopeptidase [Candidatus Shapirobacteria bacterium CG10_big_fil_rev_8_21_14_0_10_38_8]
MELQPAPDIDKEVKNLIEILSLDYLNHRRIFCFRSHGSTSRARARIWGLPRIFLIALGCQPAYCIEVISEKFDRLSEKDKQYTLIHELMHIPKNFSGALVSHLIRNMSKVNILLKKLYE